MTVDVIALLQHLVSFPALSGEEHDIAAFVESWLTDAGLPVGRFENNVYTWIGSGDTCLLLNSHLDVVPASNDHPYPAFEAVIEGNQMFGRGTVDAKASGAAMLCAAASLAEQGWEPKGGKLIIALTACEETSRPVNGLQSLLPHLPTLHGAIVGEPTSLAPCVSQKGLLILEATARGKSAHAARPDQGINAIRQAALDIVALEAMAFDRIHPQLGPITKVVTMIDGGSARNVVPEACSFVVDFRTTPSYTHAEIIDAVRAAVASDIEVSSERYVPKQTPDDSLIAKAVSATLPNAEPFGSPTVSDWAFFEETPAVKLGPGESNLSHTGQESIALDEVVAAVGVYASIAKHFFEIHSLNYRQQPYALEEGN